MSQEASVDTDILVNDDTVNDVEQDMDQVEGVGQVEHSNNEVKHFF